MQTVMAAAKLVQDVVDHGKALERESVRAISDQPDSHAEIRETAWGTCRYYIYLEQVLHSLMDKPIRRKDRLVHYLLITALYQLEFMRVPDHAVVDNSVKSLAKSRYSWAKNLVNGILRNFLRSRDDILDGIPESGATGYAFPDHLFDRIVSDWPQQGEQICAASNERPPLTLRVNTQKLSRSDYATRLDRYGLEYKLCEHSQIGITLDKATTVDKIPGFANGDVSVQDESAQLVAEALDLQSEHRVLDGCAAPGGKTGLLLEAVQGLELVAIDLAPRITMVEDNLSRLELDGETVAGSLLEPENWWDGKVFQRILLDVPCTGSGVIRRHPDIKHRRKPGDVDKFCIQQRALLNSAWNLLEPGGQLLYCTCSIFRKENDGVIDEFSSDHTDFELQSLPSYFGLETINGRQRLPGIHAGDGFYYCLARKS